MVERPQADAASASRRGSHGHGRRYGAGRRGPAGRVACRTTAQRQCPPRRRVPRTGRSPGFQPARHRQSDERPCHDRPDGPDPHVQSRRGSDHRRRAPRWPRARAAAEVLQMPEDLADAACAGSRGAATPRATTSYRTAEGAALNIGLSATDLVTPDGRTGFVLRFRTSPRCGGTNAKRARNSASPPWARWPPASRTKSATRWRRCRGSIQVLRAELQLTDDQAELMDIVMRESDRLNDTIRSFLAYARPKRADRRGRPHGPPLRDTATLLRTARKCCRSIASTSTRPTTVRSPKATRRRSVRSSGTSRPTRCGRCRTAAACSPRPPRADDGELVALEVADEGVGISTDHLDTLFQPFRGWFAGGSGLGLAIVHRIVSDYGGELP